VDPNLTRERLAAAVGAGLDRAHGEVRWGEDDCALWVAGILRDALGYDPAARWRGYVDRDGAARAVGALGLGMAIRSAAKQFGWPRIAPEDGAVGDIGVTPAPAVIDGRVERRLTTFICRAPGWWVARSERGFFAIESAGIKFAWAVV
jgi:hypothetical protein